jgi:adenylate cyclase
MVAAAMALEIERKFLVVSDAWREQARSRELLRQGYLDAGSGGRCSIRARIAGDQAWLNIKAKRSGMTRQEFEYPIPLSDADEILNELCKGPLVEKYRHEIKVGEYVWEVDEFLGGNQGLVVAEIELTHEAERFDPPAWLGEEVTHDERYYNFSLAQRPYGEWK